MPANSSNDQPKLTLILNGQPIKIDHNHARLGLWSMIPDWMKSSTIDPPEPEEGAAIALPSGMLKVARSAIKNMARPVLPLMYHALYGQPLSIGRNDSMPVLIQVLLDFVLVQAMQHTLEVTTDDQGNITQVRQTQRSDETDHATDASPQRTSGTIAS